MTAMVKYIGTADVRVISAEEWKAAGIHDMGTVVWQPSNGYCRPLTDFSMAARAIVEAEPGLVIVDTEPTPKKQTEGLGVTDEHLVESVSTGGQAPTRRR